MTTKSFLRGLALVVIMSLGICFLGDRADAVREQRRVQTTAQLSGITSYESSSRYDEISTLSNGVKVGTRGSLSYLLDASVFHPVTSGYHSIVPNGDGYVAKLGTTTYRLNSLGRVVSETNVAGETVTYD